MNLLNKYYSESLYLFIMNSLQVQVKLNVFYAFMRSPMREHSRRVHGIIRPL
jgi:hypothetical protein